MHQLLMLNIQERTFTHTTENWHGFTVGAEVLASPVPTPTAILFFGSGLFSLFSVSRFKNKKS